MALPHEPAQGPDELELLEEIASTVLGTAAIVAEISTRLEVLETLLVRYGPLLEMAEARMSGGTFGRMKRGAARVRDQNETSGG